MVKDDFPEGWVKTTLREITQNIQKINPRKQPNKKFQYCDIDSIDNNILQISNPKKFLGNNAPSRARQLIKEGDVLFSTVRTYLKNIALVPFNLDEQLASTGFCILRSYDIIVNRFIFLHVQSHEFLKHLNSIQKGTSYPAVRNEDVLDSVILLPPLNEQKCIVSKIESIFSQIDARKEKLEALASRARSIYEIKNELKSSVLTKAFEGKLVRQDPDDEPAETLKKIHKDSKKETIVEKENIPKNWITTTLENCVEILDGKRIPVSSKEREKRRGGIPYYGATRQVGWIDDYLFDEELLLLGEDGVLFFKKFKNKAYMIKGKSWVNNHAHVLRAKSEITINSFLCHYLNIFDYKNFVSGTTRLKLNQKSMKQIPVFLPHINEQRRIVSKIESIFSKIDALRWVYNNMMNQIQTLFYA